MTADLVVDSLRVGSAPELTLAARPGDIVALLGGPGTGKSALLAAIAGLQRPSSGSVLLAGGPPAPRDTGVMLQRPRLFQELTALENVSVPLLARERPVDRAAVERVLASLLLGPATWHNLVEQLSGGQQQRVAVARALVTGSPLLCLDEPVTELDETAADAVWTALRAAADAGAIAIIATADPVLAARCDAAVEMPPVQ